MSDLYKNKKHIDDFRNGALVLFLLIVVGVAALCAGIYKGKELVRAEAIALGYSKLVEGQHCWLSRRAIERGIKND